MPRLYYREGVGKRVGRATGRIEREENANLWERIHVLSRSDATIAHTIAQKERRELLGLDSVGTDMRGAR
jgi:hypothetical protein